MTLPSIPDSGADQTTGCCDNLYQDEGSDPGNQSLAKGLMSRLGVRTTIRLTIRPCWQLESWVRLLGLPIEAVFGHRFFSSLPGCLTLLSGQQLSTATGMEWIISSPGNYRSGFLNYMGWQ